MPVSGVGPRSPNARHECFVMDASVSVKAAETAELDEKHWATPTRDPRLLCADKRASLLGAPSRVTAPCCVLARLSHG